MLNAQQVPFELPPAHWPKGRLQLQLTKVQDLLPWSGQLSWIRIRNGVRWQLKRV